MINPNSTINQLVIKLMNDRKSAFRRDLNYPSVFHQYFLNSDKITRQVIGELREEAEKYENSREVFLGLVEQYIQQRGITEAYNMTTFLINFPQDPSLHEIYEPTENFQKRILSLTRDKVENDNKEYSARARQKLIDTLSLYHL